MLEIIALVYLWRHMGAVMRYKGRRPLPMQVAVVVCWLAAMFLSVFCYGVYLTSNEGPEAVNQLLAAMKSGKTPSFLIYPVMPFLAAGAAEFVLFWYAKHLPDVPEIDHETDEPL